MTTIVFGSYLIVDQAVSITNMREGYVETENDLEGLVKVLNCKNLTKAKVKKMFSADSLYIQIDSNKDSIFLNRVILVFRDEQFVEVINSSHDNIGWQRLPLSRNQDIHRSN
ncbi:MAG: hypothetical protein ABIN80_15595 [Dyadobacter sp.]|uniref:hypothetical protein n=1 Tax=Dyadobacter sp. TaxID=1914288 RepID=UPI003263BD2E